MLAEKLFSPVPRERNFPEERKSVPGVSGRKRSLKCKKK